MPTIMETGKSHGDSVQLVEQFQSPPDSLRPRGGDGGQSWSESKGPRTRSAAGHGRESDVAGQAASLPFLCLFVPFRPLRGRMVPSGLREGDCLYSVYRLKG